MKAFTKILLVGAVAGAGYMVYRQRMASRAEDDLWSEATNAPDLTSAYQPVFDSAAPDTETSVTEVKQSAAEKAGAAADKAAAGVKKAADKAADTGQKAADTAEDAASDN